MEQRRKTILSNQSALNFKLRDRKLLNGNFKIIQ